VAGWVVVVATFKASLTSTQKARNKVQTRRVFITDAHV